jgi:hypothetical protein
VSYDAMSWAMSQPVEKSSAKFVLVALANCVNGDSMLCWPSTQHLADATAQDRKTVLDNMRRLREAGYIEDTKERRGATAQVAVYRLKTPENGTVKAAVVPPSAAAEPKANGTESGTVTATVPEAVPVPNFPTNSPEIPYEQSRFSLSTVPKTGHGTRKEQVRNQEGTRKVALTIPGVPAELLNDWLEVRKAKKAGPITKTVIAATEREAAKAGISVSEAVRFCGEAGWQGFNAKWYLERQGAGGGRALNKQEALEASNRAIADRFLAKDDHAAN